MFYEIDDVQLQRKSELMHQLFRLWLVKKYEQKFEDNIFIRHRYFSPVVLFAFYGLFVQNLRNIHEIVWNDKNSTFWLFVKLRQWNSTRCNEKIEFLTWRDCLKNSCIRVCMWMNIFSCTWILRIGHIYVKIHVERNKLTRSIRGGTWPFLFWCWWAQGARKKRISWMGVRLIWVTQTNSLVSSFLILECVHIHTNVCVHGLTKVYTFVWKTKGCCGHVNSHVESCHVSPFVSQPSTVTYVCKKWSGIHECIGMYVWEETHQYTVAPSLRRNGGEGVAARKRGER